MKGFNETDIMLNNDGSIYHLNLLPKHLNDIIITVGDPSRVFQISKFFDLIEFETNHREFFTHIGSYNGKKITVISTGMGTANIEILMTELNILANFDLKKRKLNPNHRKLNIIRVGTSGAIQEDIPLGSLLLSGHAIGLDNLMSFYDLEQSDKESRICNKLKESLNLDFLPYMANASRSLVEQLRLDMKVGNTITAPGFYAPQNRLINPSVKYPDLTNKLSLFHEEDFWLTNFEMETAAYYAMGRLLGHETLSLNAILANRVTKEVCKNNNKVINSLIRTVLDSLTNF